MKSFLLLDVFLTSCLFNINLFLMISSILSYQINSEEKKLLKE